MSLFVNSCGNNQDFFKLLASSLVYIDNVAAIRININRGLCSNVSPVINCANAFFDPKDILSGCFSTNNCGMPELNISIDSERDDWNILTTGADLFIETGNDEIIEIGT